MDLFPQLRVRMGAATEQTIEEWTMTDATLTLEDGPELLGEIVDTGGDYIRIKTRTEMT